MSTQANCFNLELKKSEFHLHSLLALHTVCSGLTLFLTISIPWQLCLLLGISCSLILKLNKRDLLSRYRHLTFDGISLKLFGQQDGDDVYLVGSQFIHPFCCVLGLKNCDGKKILLPIFFDSCDAESLRKLRVAITCSSSLMAVTSKN